MCAGQYSAQAAKFGGAQFEASSGNIMSMVSKLVPQWGQREGYRPVVSILSSTTRSCNNLATLNNLQPCESTRVHKRGWLE